MTIMTRYQKIKQERAQERMRSAKRAWIRISDFLSSRGVEARVFGSIADGRCSELSDLDVMIFGDPGLDLKREILREADYASGETGVPIDIVFERDFPDILRSIRHED